jgi:GNAT superfamily N-acetyltransferase
MVASPLLKARLCIPSPREIALNSDLPPTALFGTTKIPPDLRDAFEAYIEHALTEEIDRIPAYYGERDGGFWVAVRGDKVVGTFGLERASVDAMELRRMYVDPSARRQGIARRMLQFAEDECRRRRIKRLELSTAEIQHAAIALYKNTGYRLVGDKTVEAVSNRSVGSGVRRYYFDKIL